MILRKDRRNEKRKTRRAYRYPSNRTGTGESVRIISVRICTMKDVRSSSIFSSRCENAVGTEKAMRTIEKGFYRIKWNV